MVSNETDYYLLEEIDPIQFYGRNTCKEGAYNFFWTGSGFEFSLDGSNLWIETEVPKGVLPPWICIYMNGTIMSRFQLVTGKHKVCAFYGMKSGYRKQIRIRKESPASFEGQDCFFSVKLIYTDGCFCEFDKPQMKIEALGDSITAGEGLGGGPGDIEWEACLSSCRPDYHYAEKVAERLHADLRIVAEGGWGVLSSYDNNPKHTIPYIYPYICGAADQKEAKKRGAWEKYEDLEWKPDIVFINLGTNDAAAFLNPSWIDPETGIEYKQHMDEAGNFCTKDLKKFEEAVYQFLTIIKEKNPDALILWIYGMLKNQMEEQIKTAVCRFNSEHLESEVIYVKAQDTLEVEFGSLGHPGKISHMRTAEEIIDVIKGKYS